MARHPGFPFEPRSTAYVSPGDFWAIPTRRGGWYCCGIVLAINVSEVAPSRSLIVGLLDWCGPRPPAVDTMTGATVLAHGEAHVKTIRATGAILLGHMLLDAGGLDALLNGRVVRDCPVWGYKSIEDLAHEHFGRHFPERPTRATRLPAPLRYLARDA
ncbi:hypothetical protein [Rhizomonospora bruguierae]|uniref:hypothetical protein n=1 Tax=Rhizomonospora bruguierae TaxID=1581705 RepID=UPI001BCE8D58|nr:hypothetical protein [Micromonospora sp. NBRC 107566]